MKHSQKIKMAKKMLSNKEIKDHIPIFLSKQWVNRAEQKLKKIIRQKLIKK